MITRHANEARFEDFFNEAKYIAVKNYLYNYLLRKRLISRKVLSTNPRLVLEVGSGLSPMITEIDQVVYSELSFTALQNLRAQQGSKHFVVADGTKLPFKDNAFSHTVCSEVLEHVENDVGALAELARVTESSGWVNITVPYRKFYFAADDRFVGHFRRYEQDELESKLGNAGLRPLEFRKVLGPFEKCTMFSVVMAYSLFQRIGGKGGGGRFILASAPLFRWANRFLAVIAWLDARIMPRFLTTVIYVGATPNSSSGSRPEGQGAVP